MHIQIYVYILIYIQNSTRGAAGEPPLRGQQRRRIWHILYTLFGGAGMWLL